ncbi:hypothetical protein [Lysinibacillus fusiformis]|uniref:hypothetical protein n=1 Tax=Lysinibacillus fusiformis TaxID=28031 RepID=UPI000468C491|nr:hypothetical protein [Lysinibacillus fusiformis]
MARKVKEKYILFTGDAHETVKFDFTAKQIEIFITLWNLGLSINKIAQRLNTSKVSATLIVMDLEMTGRIEARAGGLLGKQKVVS